MNPILVLIIAFFIFMLLNMPLSIAIGASSLLSIFASGLPGILLPQQTFSQLNSFSLMAVPIFILAGEIMERAGITSRIVRLASALIGHVRAGLAQVSILASMLMAGISGSAAADASALGAMLIPSMVSEGYDDDFAVAVLAAGNTIGPIIPPSIMMIIFGSMTGVSIGAMFIGGVVPGILFGVGCMAVIWFMSRKRNFPKHARASIKEIFGAFWSALGALVMPFIIVGGILSGFFTATESGVIAIVYAIIYGLARKTVKIKDIPSILIAAAKSSVTPMFLIGIAAVMGWILARNDMPAIVGSLFAAVTDSPVVLMIIIWAFYLFIGMFMEDTAAMIILVPILFPLATSYGVDPVHFGVFTVVTLLIGCITPPVGMLLFVCSAIGKIKVSKVYKTILPFVIVLALVSLLMAIFPSIVTGLGSLLG